MYGGTKTNQTRKMKSTLKLFVVIFLFYACSTDQSIDELSNNIADIPSNTTSSNSPNILLIIADDMGVDATPGYTLGNIKPNMPTLQKLQSEGITYNNVWSNPTCTPTRATMLTGKYGFKTGVTMVDDVLSTSETSIQSYLKTNGASEYSSAVIGKWHLSKNDSHPNNMGIDYFAGLTGGGVQSYWNWNLNINGQSTVSDQYTTTKFTDLAIEWVAEQDNPWFLWLAFNAPHSPFHLPPNELHSQGNLPTDEESINTNPLPYYMAMIEAMDSEIGRLLNSMDTEELENTLILFIGDNGTPGQVIQEQTKYRAKGSIYQGGVHVPLVIAGKDVLRMGSFENSLINTTDLFATIANVAGISGDLVHDSQSFYESFNEIPSEKRTYAYAEGRKDTGNYDLTIRNETHKYMLFDDGTEGFYKLNIGDLETTNLLDASLSNSDENIKNELTSKLNEIRN